MGENLKILREAYNPDRGYMLLILIGQPSVYAFLARSNLDSTARGANSKQRLLCLYRLCSATFEQLLAFGATFCGITNLEQFFFFLSNF